MTHQPTSGQAAHTSRNTVRTIDAWTDAVPLQDGSVALVDRADRLALETQGIIGPWFLNSNGKGQDYVRTKGETNLLTVARLIVQAKPGEHVRYRNGDRRDLRRANLVIEPPVTWQQEARQRFPHSPAMQQVYLAGMVRGLQRARSEQRRMGRQTPALLCPKPPMSLEAAAAMTAGGAQ